MAETGQSDPTVIWDAQPRQALFINCPADDVGFGGARGGGKSDAVIGDWLSHEDLYGQHAIGMAFRRERTQLVELIERARQVLRPLGHVWHEQDKYFRGPKGGRLRFTYLERDSDADAYQGHSYTRLYPEEMGTFPLEAPINKLQATLRSGHGVPCQMKGTCNPGGPGHQWVKERYKLAEHPKGLEVFKTEFVNPFTKARMTKSRVFIPSKVTDNQYLGDDYVANLFQVGSEALVRAWLEGDWSVVEGAFFDCWDKKHVIRPIELPQWWGRFRSGDWGSAKPFSIGWWAVATDPHPHPDGFTIPRGALIRYREWYGKKSANVGLKYTAEQVAKGVIERTPKDEEIAYTAFDPSVFSEDGGPSLFERMQKAGLKGIRPADNKRIAQYGHMGGWDQMRDRMLGDDWEIHEGVLRPTRPDWRPMIYCFDTCRDSIRTIPALQHDDLKPEDLDTEGEDHAADEWRYACMSRPYTRQKPQKARPIEDQPTWNERFARHQRQKRQVNTL